MTDALVRLTAAIEHANQALDWIEQRQGPLRPDDFATIETDVQTVRALRGLVLLAGWRDIVIWLLGIHRNHRGRELADPDVWRGAGRVRVDGPGCDDCYGLGAEFVHTPSCGSDFCTGSGDEHSCTGEWLPCSVCGTCAAPAARRGAMPASGYTVCSECGVVMNCDEIDAAYLPERDEWTCGPCVRAGRDES